MNASARALLLVIPLAFALAACGNNNTTTTSPSTPSLTETFNGTLKQGGANIHTFTAGVGDITATLTAVGPLATLSLGMSLGTWDGTTCTVVLDNQNVKTGTALTGTTSSAVNLCVRVYDVGNISDQASYTVSVVHY